MVPPSLSDTRGNDLGRRARKKAQTRATIATAALELFLERGFDDVGIREIADHADVAVATVFAHFPSKEALVFDEDDEVIASLLAAVTDRPEGTGVLAALEDWFLVTTAAQQERARSTDLARFHALVDATPALRNYWQSTWRRHKDRLADAVSETSSLSRAAAELLATLVIEGFLLAADRDDTTARLTMLFAALRSGFDAAETAGRHEPPRS